MAVPDAPSVLMDAGEGPVDSPAGPGWRRWVTPPDLLNTIAVALGLSGAYLAFRAELYWYILPILALAAAVLAHSRGRRMAEQGQDRLQRAVTYETLRSRQQTLLRELASRLLEVESMEELYREIVRVARSLFDAESAAVFLLAEEGRFLRTEAAAGSYAAMVGRLLPAERSLVGWVAGYDEGVICDDAARDPRVLAIEGIARTGRRIVAAPLRSSGLVLGTLAVADRVENRRFGSQDLELLQTLADQVAVGIDRTRALEESRRGRAALLEKNEELLRATRLKSEFLANMSHELRTPLNAIIGFSDLMLAGATGQVEGEQREYTEAIARNGRHLLAMISDVLDLAKVEAGQMSFDLAPMNLEEAIHGAVSDTASLRAAKAQSCEVRVEGGDLTVIGDLQRIRQVLFNLLSNASKFTQAGGHIRLAALRARVPLPVPADRAGDRPGILTRDAAWVAVSDDGIGIRREDLPKLFVEFSQVDSSASRQVGGTGLGLALSKRFVERHGGAIGVESIYGTGSTFWFFLPVEGPVRRHGTGSRAGDLGHSAPEPAVG